MDLRGALVKAGLATAEKAKEVEAKITEEAKKKEAEVAKKNEPDVVDLKGRTAEK